MKLHHCHSALVPILCAATFAACTDDHEAIAPTAPLFSVGESAGPDTVAPELVRLAIGPRHVDVDAGPRQVQLRATATDGGSGAYWLLVVFESPSGAHQASCSTLASDDGTPGPTRWQCDALIPRFAEPGDWSIRFLALQDRLGNERRYTTDDLEAAHVPTTVRVVSTTPDLAAPRVAALTIDPESVDVTAGQATVEIRATLTDDVSGVQSAQFNIVSPSGNQVAWCDAMTLDAGDGSSGEWSCTVTIEPMAEAGEWRIFRFWTWDQTGQLREYTTEALEAEGLPTRVTVVSGAADTEAPTLLNIAISPDSVDLATGEQSVELSVTAADDGTGVSRVIVFVGLPDFSSAGGCLASVPVEGDRSSGTFTCNIWIAADAGAGEWKVLDVTIQDAVGNSRFFTTADLEAAGHDVTLKVTRP